MEDRSAIEKDEEVKRSDAKVEVFVEVKIHLLSIVQIDLATVVLAVSVFLKHILPTMLVDKDVP